MALAAPRLSAAPPQRHRVVWLSVTGKSAAGALLHPFLEGMAALGYVPGRNFELQECWGENSRETLDRLAREAAALKPTLFVSQGAALQVAQNLPGNIPVVFGTSADPVEGGVAASMARPGGRFTGITFLAYELVGKRVELLHEVAPNARRLAVLSNTEHRGDSKELVATREAAAGLQLEVSHYPATNTAELESALGAIAAARTEALVVHPDALILQNRAAVARFALEHRIPAISGWAAIAEAGTLMTYGPVLGESFRRLAYFVDRILRGTKPAEIPIEYPTKVELVLNLKTARALGITVPQRVLVRADRVIE